jgi:hypothetical protein
MGSRAKSRRFLRALAERAPPGFIATTTNLAATVSPLIAFVVRVYTDGIWTEGKSQPFGGTRRLQESAVYGESRRAVYPVL